MLNYFLITLIILSTNVFAKIEKATFAGGCFWCMEPPFEKYQGVIEVVSGYSGGKEVNPEYKQVAGGLTGHRESVQVSFDSSKISYSDLLEIYWRSFDPTDAKGQFVDRGKQYSSAIFYHTKEQKELAIQSKEKLQKSKRFQKEIVTPIIEFNSFYRAEKYHQDYYKVNPIRYKFYRYNSGRDKFIDTYWKDDRIYKSSKLKKN